MNELQHEADFSEIRSRHLLSGPRLPPVLTVVVPTFNEVGERSRARRAVSLSLAGLDWEIVFVDDNSPDGYVGQSLGNLVNGTRGFVAFDA